MQPPPTYNELWVNNWGDLQAWGPVHRHLRRSLISTVSALDVKSILDVGCGSGENLAALAELGRYELTGLDISPQALDLAKRRVPAAHLSQLDIAQNTLAEQFDLVISIQVIEHIADDVAALLNIARMTRSYAFISTIQGRMRPSELGIGHVRNYSAIELRRKLASVGLEVIKMWGWGFPFYSPIYRSIIEWLKGGVPQGPMGPFSRLAAACLFQLYHLNIPGRGDILNVLARPKP